MQASKRKLEKTGNEAVRRVPSRRNLIKGCLSAVGAMSLGGLSLNVRSGTHAGGGVRAGSEVGTGGISAAGQNGNAYRPGYLDLESNVELERREQALRAILESQTQIGIFEHGLCYSTTTDELY
ncbi:MAG: hypothetical protein LBE79_00960 [Tannerella sp.]|nr:hypothetical protein [Tannerella sp.]